MTKTILETKKIPQRMCVACRQMKDKNTLIRIVKSPQGEIKVDESLKAQGRGMYICNNTECANKAVKSRLINRAFRTEVQKCVYERITEVTGLGKG